MNNNEWACGHVQPNPKRSGPQLTDGTAQKYVVTCELPRGHKGDHKRYGFHWQNDGSNEGDRATAAGAVAGDLPRAQNRVSPPASVGRYVATTAPAGLERRASRAARVLGSDRSYPWDVPGG